MWIKKGEREQLKEQIEKLESANNELNRRLREAQQSNFRIAKKWNDVVAERNKLAKEHEQFKEGVWLKIEMANIAKTINFSSDLTDKLRKDIQEANSEIEQMKLIGKCLLDMSECEAAIHERRTLAREQIITTVLEYLGEEIK